MSQDIAGLKNVVEGFRLLNRKFEIERWQSNHLTFTSLLSGWRTLNVMLKHLERLTAPDYNVFYVMKNMSTSEVKLHSPFLADLFNIHGEHKQGNLFYRELVKLLELPSSIYLPTDEQWFEVGTEVASGTGGIDILISYKYGLQKFGIAIENKIYAGDQHEQLERYHTFLRKEFGEHFALIYLTPDGRKPSTHSASDEFTIKYHIHCLSYYEDIISLLQKSIPQIQAPNVRIIVEQYLTICQSI
jgi:hypothetical protein